MNADSDERVFLIETYTAATPVEDLDESLQTYFESLEDEMYGVEQINLEDEQYTFTAVGSEVDIDYELEETEGTTELDIEFAGAKPLVQRFYKEFEGSWDSGEFLSF